MKVLDFEATLQRVGVGMKPFEDESPEQFQARVRHTACLLVEHNPNGAVYVEVEDKKEEE
jgi:hypothetical protein